jgi:hypothetical protein
MSEKRLLLRVIGSKHPPFRLQIKPGTTVSDIRAHLNLSEKYLLTFAWDPNDPFAEDDDLHSLTRDGERLLFRFAPDAQRQQRI